MKIGIIADTHGKLPDFLAQELEQADEIWHLGDVCDDFLAAKLHAIGPKLFIVRGNNDHSVNWPPILRLERAGKIFVLSHYPPKTEFAADVYLHGHTHVPCDHQIGKMRVLNPGAVGKANKGAPPSYAWLNISEKTGRMTWSVVPLPAARRA